MNLDKTRNLGLLFLTRYWPDRSVKISDCFIEKHINEKDIKVTKQISIAYYTLKNFPIVGINPHLIEKFSVTVNRMIIKAILKKLSKDHQNLEIIYLGLHDLEIFGEINGQKNMEQNEDLRQYLEELKNESNCNSIEGYTFQHETKTPLNDCLRKFTEKGYANITEEEVNSFYQEVVTEGFKKDTKRDQNPGNSFSFLKHRIAHIWLPLDIDLQGIKEVGAVEKKAIYLGEVLKEKKETTNADLAVFYRRKLARLWFAVVPMSKNEAMPVAAPGADQDGGKTAFECKPVKPGENAKALLVDGKSILEYLRESPKRNEDQLAKEWGKLLAILGLSFDKNKPFDEKGIKAIPKSPILHFVCYLDHLMSKWDSWDSLRESVREKAAEEVVNWLRFKELLVSLDFPISDLPFHDWFCALDEQLGKIREAAFQ